MKTVFQRVRQKTRIDLPAAHCREIGRIVVRWAHFERYIQAMIWAITLNGDAKGAALGRVAIRESKPEEQLGLLEWVAEIRGVKLNRVLLKAMKKKTKPLAEKRNLVAHGLWTDTPGSGWAVQQTRGVWEEIKGGPKGSRRITPEAIPMDVSSLRNVVQDLEALIADARTLKGLLGE